MAELTEFKNIIEENLANNSLVKLTLSKRRNKSSEIKNIFIKPIEVKAGLKLSFVYRHNTKDVTKNYEFAEAIEIILNHLENEFSQANLFSLSEEYILMINKKYKCKIITKKLSGSKEIELSHDKNKKRFVDIENNIYLRELNILTKEWEVKKDKSDKYRQINKYVEIIDGIIRNSNLPNNCNIADMGCGKGYLTFALYDYLSNKLNLKPNITGVEMRPNLVDTCNGIAKKSDFENLNFITGTIKDTDLPNLDMLIALHACDTATDDAIYRGIKSDAKIIICAPCCHKQIRKQLNPTSDIYQISKHGILAERQAELLTDGMRALILEAYGYKTKVFEFISTEHTPKNVLLVAVKQDSFETVDQERLKQLQNIKAVYNIKYHQLEKLLGIKA